MDGGNLECLCLLDQQFDIFVAGQKLDPKLVRVFGDDVKNIATN
jgi:hypothetical protein